MRKVTLLSLLCGLAAAAAASNAKTKDATVNSWLTTADASTGSVIQLLESQGINHFTKALNASSTSIEYEIDINSVKQPILGYGAGLPQSSAYVLVQLKNSHPDLYSAVLKKLFGNGEDGAAINILRFPIGSCDFSINMVTYDDTTDDYALGDFAIDADSWNIVAVLKDVLAINPNFVIMATPWSPPAWLKTLKSLIPYSEKNTLLDEDSAYESYANYLVKVFEAYQAQGIPITYFTLQNEPLFGNSDQYPGMYFSAEQAVRLGNLVNAKLAGRGVKLLAYDHNWDHPEYPLEVLAKADSGAFVGTAWHCYGGDMASAQDAMHEQYPAAEQHLTECTGSFPDGTCDITKGMVDFGWNHEWDMGNILLGGAAHWSSSGVKWILALDENCGPTLPKVTYKCGRPLVSVPSWAASIDDVHFNQDFESIRHMSKFLLSSGVPNRVHRVATNTVSGAAGSLTLESFYDAVSGQVTVIAMNTDHADEVQVTLSQGSEGGVSFTDTLPAFSTKVYQWRA